MKRLLALGLLALGTICAAQTVTTPIVQPHQTFLDNSGSPCAGCSLYSYVAGTTTPQPTYTDSSGASQNANPIILDAAGGANIWLGISDVYKFVLKDASGTLVWTVDNVKNNSGSLPCLQTNAIQFANTAAGALTCDPSITINPSSHALQIGGSISGPAFTLRNLNTITSSWTLDVTSPSTALTSLGPVPLTDMATQTADSVVMNATGSTATPTAVVMPSGCTNGVNYSTATHTWTCAATSIPLSSLATQPADSVVMNATGAAASPTAVPLPACTQGITYSTTTHAWSCYYPSASVCTDVTASRSFGTVYTATNRVMVHVTGQVNGGSGDSRITASWGSGLSLSNTTTTTIYGGTDGLTFLVPAGLTYSVLYQALSGSPALSLQKWVECTF